MILSEFDHIMTETDADRLCWCSPLINEAEVPVFDIESSILEQELVVSGFQTILTITHFSDRVAPRGHEKRPRRLHFFDSPAPGQPNVYKD